MYDRVRQAIAEGRALTCRYESVDDGKAIKAKRDQEFVFKPYALFFSQRAWYTVGHHSGRDALRCLKLNRFTDVAATKLKYTIPKDFTLTDHLGKAWRMIRGGTTHDVEVRFDANFAETIADTAWHATQQIDYHDDGSITFRCEVDGLDEIVWWVLSMGPHCQVMKPKALRDRVVALAQQVVDRYRA